MKHSPHLGLSQKKWSKDYLVTVPWAYSLLNYSIVSNASITGLFDQVLQALLCNFSPLCKADSVFFGSLTRPHMTVSLTAEIHARGTVHTVRQSSCLSLNWLNTLIFPVFYYPAWWLYPATSFVVSASKPSIRQIVGTTDVIEVFSTITDSGRAVERQTPSGLTYQTVESTFLSGEVMRESSFAVEDWG